MNRAERRKAAATRRAGGKALKRLTTVTGYVPSAALQLTQNDVREHLAKGTITQRQARLLAVLKGKRANGAAVESPEAQPPVGLIPR